MKAAVHFLRRRAIILIGVIMVGCLASGGSCPCGADSDTPFDQHDLGFAGRHVVENSCVCQCGDATPVARPKQDGCTVHEIACEDLEGGSRTFTCY